MPIAGHPKVQQKWGFAYLTSRNPFFKALRDHSRFLKLTAQKIGKKMNLPAKDARAYSFYRQVLGILNRTSVPFLMGGGFALEFYTHLGRGPKDMDLVIQRQDLEKVFEALNDSGLKPELAFSHWLGKVYGENDCVDI